MINKKNNIIPAFKKAVSNDIFVGVILFFLGIFTRLPFIAQFSNYPDDAQWALALKYFTLIIIPPGHPMFIMLAKLANYFTGDFHYSFIALSVLFSGLFACGIFYCAKQIMNKKVGIIASFIFLSSPFFWYYGVVTIYFMPIAFFGIMTALYCCKVIINGQRKYILQASVFYALLIGIRPQEFIALFPLWCWALYRAKQSSFKGIVVFTLACLVWFVPLLIFAGGVLEYFKSIMAESRHSVGGLFLYGLPLELIKKNFTLKFKVLFLTFGVGVVPLFYYLYPIFNLKAVFNSIKTRFFLVWIMPTMILWTFILFARESMGYLVTPFSAVLIYLAVAIDGISKEVREVLGYFSVKLKVTADSLTILSTIVLVCLNAFIFLYDYDPLGKAKDNFEYQSAANIRKKDQMLGLKYSYIKEKFDPQNTIILTRFWYFFSTMYHLPEYKVYGFDSIDNTNQGTTLRFSYNHQKRYYPGWGDVLEIPKGINRVVLFDDEFLEWNKSANLSEVITFNRGYVLQIVKVKEGQIIKCDFKNFKVVTK